MDGYANNMGGYRSRIYTLLLKEQDAILHLLNMLGVSDAKNKIKGMLDEELFEVIESDSNSVSKIRKKSTGDIFERGGRFYHERHGKWIDGCCFDEYLFGCYFSNSFYKNYVRGNGGIYHLNEISTSETTERKKLLLIESSN